MKYILLFLLIPVLSNAQIKEASPYILGGGIALTVGAALTPNETRWDSSTNSYKDKGLFEQGAKSMAFGCGLAVTFTGVISSLTGNPYRGYRKY